MARPRSNGNCSRLRKLECPACGWHCRTSAAMIRLGAPLCACGAGALQVPELKDAAVVDWDALAASFTSLRARNAAMRELGYPEAVESRSRGRRTKQPQCKHDGCSRFRAYGELYCPKHAELEAMPF